MDESFAEKRRKALKRVFDDHGINPTDLARCLEWPTPNLIYNFFNGHSKSLSAENYWQISNTLPGVTMEELMGEMPKKATPPVLVKTQCQAGLLRDSFSFPTGKIRELPLPIDDVARQAGAFAAQVKHPGAELIYPERSLLLCVPMDSFKGKITKGRRLLIERLMDVRIEVTVREVQEDSERRLWLSQRSSDPRFAGSVKLPVKVTGKPWQDRGERYVIAGVIIGAFVPES